MIISTPKSYPSNAGQWTLCWALVISGGFAIVLTAERSLELAGLSLVVAMALLIAIVVLARDGIPGLLLPAGMCSALLLPLNALRPLPWLSLADVFLALLMTLALIARGLQGEREAATQLRLYYVGAFMLVIGGFLGSYTSESLTVSLLNVLRLTIAAVGVPACLIMWRPSHQQVMKMLWAWQAGNTMSVVAGLAYARAYDGRVYGLTTHPNHFGLLCLLSVGIGCALFVGSRPSIWRLNALGSTVLGVIGVFESGSRAALLGSAVLLVAVIWASKGSSGILILSVLVIAYVLIAPRLTMLSEHSAYIRLIEDDRGVIESNTGRIQLLRLTWADIRRQPFVGVGLENATRAHNIYLQMWAGAGLLGLAGFALVTWLSVRPFLAILFCRGSPLMSPRELVSAAYLSYLVAALFSNNVWDRYLWLVVGIVLTLETPNNAASVPQRFLNREASTDREPVYQSHW
jgi:O-antigen ligase